VRDLGIEMTDDIRGVFDKMLGGEINTGGRWIITPGPMLNLRKTACTAGATTNITDLWE